MKNYEINNNTIALIKENSYTTKVLEDETEYLIENEISNIINDSCEFFGSSYKGRIKGSRKLINGKYKMPIIIEETMSLIFFPTTASECDTCMWISLNQIKSYSKDEQGSYVIIQDGRKIYVDISLGSLQNQIYRANMLKSAINNRKLNQNI
ncbi:MAG: competence protein ComK [Bacilli bacterium]